MESNVNLTCTVIIKNGPEIDLQMTVDFRVSNLILLVANYKQLLPLYLVPLTAALRPLRHLGEINLETTPVESLSEPHRQIPSLVRTVDPTQFELKQVN